MTERTGVPATTLRFYEQQGLLPAQRSAAGYRLYDDAAVDRLGFIGAGKHLGLPLEEIRELLGVWESGLCVQVQDRLRPLLRAGLESAERRARELAVFTERLQRALIRLDGPAREGRCDPSCEFLLRDDASPTGAFAPDADPLVDPPLACSLSAGQREAQLGRWRRLVASGEELARSTAACGSRCRSSCWVRLRRCRRRSSSAVPSSTSAWCWPGPGCIWRSGRLTTPRG